MLMDFHNFLCTTSQENAKVIGEKFFCHTFVMLLPYRVKVSDTKVTHFTPVLALCTCLYRSETSIDETNKTQQKVRGSKFMFKMSTIYANTCIQTTTPLHHRWWFRWQWPVLVLYAAALLGTMGWGQRWLVPEYSSAEYAYAGYPLCFRGLLPFFSKMGHWHIVHVTLSSCCRERRQSLSLQRCGHLIRQIWIWWTTASGVCLLRRLPLADPW